MDHSYMFCNYDAVFPQVSIIFYTVLPTLSKALYASIVKLPASTLEHILSGIRKL
jgi:hypothetical protein